MRPAVAADRAALSDLFVASALSNAEDRDVLLAHPDALELPPEALEEGRTRVATAAGGRIVGFATTIAEADVLVLDDLFVDPAWMGRGVGRALVHDAATTARRLGLASIEVTANDHARGFYEKVGFVTRHAVATRLGRGTLMRLDLVR